MSERHEGQPRASNIDPEERYKAERAASYETHKQHGSLGIHYLFYPEDRPKLPLKFYEQEHGLDDRSR